MQCRLLVNEAAYFAVKKIDLLKKLIVLISKPYSELYEIGESLYGLPLINPYISIFNSDILFCTTVSLYLILSLFDWG